MKKYETVGKPNADGLRQIRALRDFGNIKSGNIGGWLQSEDNLSQDSDCWVYKDAKVYRDTRIYNDTKVYGGDFFGGEFNGGTFNSGTYYSGTFFGGEFNGGTFHGGEFNGGVFHYGMFRGGEFNGGTFHGGEFNGGVYYGGEFRGGIFRGGEFHGGAYYGGIFHDGAYYGGTFHVSPLFVQGSMYCINHCDVGKISIGCETHNYEEWLKIGDDIAFQNDLTADIIAEYRAYLHFLIPLCKKRDVIM